MSRKKEGFTLVSEQDIQHNNQPPKHTSASGEENKKQSDKYGYYEQGYGGKIHHFYLSSALEGPEHYTEMVQIINSATPNDKLIIHLNTPGGRLDTTSQIVNALRTTQAHVTTIVEGHVASAGTLIFMVADEMTVREDTIMMFHNYSGGAIGKGHELTAEIHAKADIFEKMMKNIYYPFFSYEEIDEIIGGKDFWLGYDEVSARLDNMMEVIEKEKKQAENKQTEKKTNQKSSSSNSKAPQKKTTSKKSS